MAGPDASKRPIRDEARDRVLALMIESVWGDSSSVHSLLHAVDSYHARNACRSVGSRYNIKLKTQAPSPASSD